MENKVYEVTRQQAQTKKNFSVTVKATSKDDAAYRAAGILADQGVTFTYLLSVKVAE